MLHLYFFLNISLFLIHNLKAHVATRCRTTTSTQVRDQNNQYQSAQCNAHGNWHHIRGLRAITVASGRETRGVGWTEGFNLYIMHFNVANNFSMHNGFSEIELLWTGAVIGHFLGGTEIAATVDQLDSLVFWKHKNGKSIRI